MTRVKRIMQTNLNVDERTQTERLTVDNMHNVRLLFDIERTERPYE